MAQVTIREACPGDTAFIATLLGQLGYPAAEEETARRYERLSEDGQRLIVAELEEAPAGVAVIQIYPVLIHDAPTCRLAVLVTAEGTRRRGIGRALVEAAEEEARRAGCDRIVLESGVWRDEANEFYRALGYEGIAHGFSKRL